MRQGKRASIGLQIYAATLAVTSTALLLFAGFLWWHEQKSLDFLLLHNGRTLAAGLAKGVSLGVVLRDEEFIRDAAGVVADMHGVEGVDVYDANGNRLALVKGKHPPLSSDAFAGVFEEGVWYHRTLPGGLSERFVHRVGFGRDNAVGYVVLDLSRAPILEVRHQAKVATAGAFALLVLMLVLANRFVINLLLRALGRLQQAVSEVKEGRMNVRLDTELPPPLDDIAAAFNAMMDALAGHRARLEQSEQRYRSLFQNVPMPIYRTKIDGRLEACNPAMATLFGYPTPEELMREHPNVRSLYVDPAQRQALVDDLLRLGSVQGREVRLQTQRAGVRDCLIYARVVYDDAGEPEGIEGMIQDRTEIQRLEENLLQAQKMQALGTLAGSLAHDFNNMLAVIVGNAGILARKCAGCDVSQPVGHILKAAEKGRAITGRLLGLARPEGMRHERVDVPRILQEVGELISVRETQNVRIETLLPAQPLYVIADPDQLQQLFMNLAINGVQAMPEGGTLTLECAEEGNWIRATVRDEGIGMDAETKRRIFDPFFTTKKEQGGSGLGLAMAFRVVQAAGGTIEVESEPGKGSAFHVRLPRYDGGLRTKD